MSTAERLASMRDALHRQFRELGYTTNSQTSELLDLVFAAFAPADGGGQGVTPLTPEQRRKIIAECRAPWHSHAIEPDWLIDAVERHHRIGTPASTAPTVDDVWDRHTLLGPPDDLIKD